MEASSVLFSSLKQHLIFITVERVTFLLFKSEVVLCYVTQAVFFLVIYRSEMTGAMSCNVVTMFHRLSQKAHHFLVLYTAMETGEVKISGLVL